MTPPLSNCKRGAFETRLLKPWLVTRRFVRLPSLERRLLPRLLLLMAAIRLGLWLTPFSLLRRFLRQRPLAALFPRDLCRMSGERLAWAVEVASRPIPDATCLAQSLALQFLLARSGQPSVVRIGVLKTVERRFQAHAWIDCAGQVLLNRPEDVVGYTVLASLEAV